MSYFHENVQNNVTKISTYEYFKIFLCIWKCTENEKIKDVHTFNYEQIPTLILHQGDSVQAGKQEHTPKLPPSDFSLFPPSVGFLVVLSTRSEQHTSSSRPFWALLQWQNFALWTYYGHNTALAVPDCDHNVTRSHSFYDLLYILSRTYFRRRKLHLLSSFFYSC